MNLGLDQVRKLLQRVASDLTKMAGTLKNWREVWKSHKLQKVNKCMHV